MKSNLKLRTILLLLSGFWFVGCATTADVKVELDSQTPDKSNTRIFNSSNLELKAVALKVMEDYGIKVNNIEENPNDIKIIGKKGMSLMSSGEFVGIAIKPAEVQSSSVVTVLSKKVVSTQIFAKNWTSDILDGISAKARYEKDYSNNEKYDQQAPNEDWLNSVSKAMSTALAFETKPALGVKCEGRFGEYISGKIVSHLGSHNDKIELVAVGENLTAIVEQQGLQMTGLFDEKTAVATGKLAGAKYLLVCSPYIKAAANVVELHCKLVNIETAKFLGGGLIVHFPLKDLPAL